MKKYLFIFILAFSTTLNAQVFFNTTPTITLTSTGYSTGAAFADINRDGYLDLVFSDGNDMARGKMYVYLNTNGTFALSPSWQSSDIDYHGKLAVGDINNDGWPDVAVSVYLGAAGFSQKGKLKIYMNNNGTLSSSPSWVSADSLYTFSCTLGDMNGDGYLDLCAATGESYNNLPDQMRIYFNNNGTLNTLPGWKSAASFYGMDVKCADINKDGKLDLLFAGERGPARMFLNYGDSIATVFSWSSADANPFSNSCYVSDVNNDGYLDFAVSDNNQLGGTGKYKLYMNNSGTLATTPVWTSTWGGYGSGIAIADFNNDNLPEFIGGGWWQPARIYQNFSGTFQPTPVYTSSTSSVVETIAIGDYDNDGLSFRYDIHTGNGTKKLFYFGYKPVQRLTSVTINNDTVPKTQYCCDFDAGWISFANAPANGSTLKIVYYSSFDLDFAISNWDASLGNYIFKNNIIVDIKKIESPVPKNFNLYQNYPNPFNPVTKIKFDVKKSEIKNQYSVIKLIVYDLNGKEITTLVNREMQPGSYEVTFDASNLSSGTYFYKLETNDFKDSKKFILMK